MGRIEAIAYAFFTIPPMYVFVNEVLLLHGKLGVALAIYTLLATFGLMYVSIREAERYIASRIKDDIKASHASGFLHILPFSLAFIRAVQRTPEMDVYLRLLLVRVISMAAPLIVTFIREARLSRSRCFLVSSRLPFLVFSSPRSSYIRRPRLRGVFR